MPSQITATLLNRKQTRYDLDKKQTSIREISKLRWARPGVNSTGQITRERIRKVNTDYTITYSITDEQDQISKKDLVSSGNSQNEPNLDTIFGYIARKEPALDKAKTLAIRVVPFGNSVKTFPELGRTLIKQLLKRQGLKQTLTARKTSRFVITITVEIGASNNPTAASWEYLMEGVSVAPPGFAEAVRLAEGGDIAPVRKLLEGYEYECKVVW